MATLSITGDGTPIAIIRGGRDGDKIIDIRNTAENEPAIREITLVEGTFESIPNIRERQIDRLYVSGPTGCGKSTYCHQYVRNCLRMNPSMEFYIFSRLDSDESSKLDELQPIRIIVDDDFAKMKIDISQFSNSVCLFDDIDVSASGEASKKAQKLLDQMLQVGRHNNINVIYANHMACNYKQTRLILAEANKIVLFPSSGDHRNVERVLKEYVGLSDDFIRQCMRNKSRYILISKTAPMYVLTETGVFIPKSKYEKL